MNFVKRAKILVSICLVVFISCKKDEPTKPDPPQEQPSLSALHTQGRWFLNEQDDKVLLRGVNIPSLEWTASGDNMLQSVDHMIHVWGCNVLRIPLSQDRWYGYGPEQTDDGSAYRRLVEAIIKNGNEKGAYILLDLHWSNGNQWGEYIGQHIMPDENSLTFWRDVATLYKNHPAVLFGLYNEPYGIDWDIWRNGGEVNEYYNRNNEDVNITYRAVGHQELYEVIRETGADNIVIAGGIDWGYDVSGILNGYALDGYNIAYDTHPYPWKDENWDGKWGDVGEHYPIIVGEWGLNKEEAGHQQYGINITQYMRRKKFCWAAWCLHPSAGPQLIKDWNYTPTWFGELTLRELAAPVDLED